MKNKDRLLKQYDHIHLWFHHSLAGITEEESLRRIHPEMNHIKYLAGHLVNAQYGIGVIAGAASERKWNDLFGGLSKTRALDGFPYPALDEIIEEWDKIYSSTREAFLSMSEEDLNGEKRGFSMAASGIYDDTIGDYWAFMNEHQMYHIGQIGILRRALGKDPMKLF